MTPPPLILRAFRQPEQLSALDPAEWDLLIRQARKANLLASLHVLLQERSVLAAAPAGPREHLAWADALAQRHMLAVRQEVSLIRQALQACAVPVILLKGAAYVMAQLPSAHGRLFSDIDILVPKERLDQVEAALMLHGWAATHHDAYDQRYYRTWMHELPPMRHIRRMTVIDVHHAIVPDTAPVYPDPAKLRASACPVEGQAGLLTLAPADMVLHSAVHLFHDGELDNGLRDLVDLDRLLRHFGSQPSFWPMLIERARTLELTRPLFYALRYTHSLLHTNVPTEALAQATRFGHPGNATLALMDALFSRALLPEHPSCADRLSGLARQMLYIRASWLRMPPLLLARHLFHKAFLSPRLAESAP
ncbi:nucleotidyltransferase family protein [Janthinobacterium sp. 17J80-10]|uniref:nucleotidyltransferase domain-containing protein n=1 Tax=Janthinobacterium sp. 17J80-10 TaxID=2497863 RepID=UPI0010058122|nr:nucleotidyltransferase family protein [Janthinobacterium sp. 17J80-10]QAU35385.1 hypothetical protein EKL02_15065 [Janthinobacterium sp. 17J80-10]